MDLSDLNKYITNEIPITSKNNILSSIDTIKTQIDILYNHISDSLSNKYYFNKENNMIIYIKKIYSKEDFTQCFNNFLFNENILENIQVAQVKVISYSKIKSIFNRTNIEEDILCLNEFIESFYKFELANEKMIEFINNKMFDKEKDKKIIEHHDYINNLFNTLVKEI